MSNLGLLRSYLQGVRTEACPTWGYLGATYRVRGRKHVQLGTRLEVTVRYGGAGYVEIVWGGGVAPPAFSSLLRFRRF